MEYILLIVIKILDNMIATSKSILTHKNKAVAASLLVVCSQILFFLVVSQVVNDNSMTTILVVSFAGGLGSFLAFFINRKFSKDQLYVNIITAKEKEDMKILGDYMRDNGIKLITMDSYNKDLELTLTALIFANTKEQSSKIDEFIKRSESKYLRQVLD